MKKKQYTKSLELIDKIQKIRSKNNKNWMDLLRLSFKLDPKTSSKILSQIFFDDQKISNLAKKLYLLNKENN
tara:strand:- start:26 stop:241 length:216 start_codon:yes stop_codon:yes gene_type:complete